MPARFFFLCIFLYIIPDFCLPNKENVLRNYQNHPHSRLLLFAFSRFSFIWPAPFFAWQARFPRARRFSFLFFSLFLFPFSLFAIKAGWGEKEYGRNKTCRRERERREESGEEKGAGEGCDKNGNCVEHLLIRGTLLPKQKPVLCRNWMESTGMKEGKGPCRAYFSGLPFLA